MGATTNFCPLLPPPSEENLFQYPTDTDTDTDTHVENLIAV